MQNDICKYQILLYLYFFPEKSLFALFNCLVVHDKPHRFLSVAMG